MAIRPVFFYIETGSIGGGSKMLLRLLRSLPADEFDPVLLTQNRGEVAREAADAGIEVQVVPFEGVLDTYDQGLFDLPSWKKPAVPLRILQFNVRVRRILADADIIWCQNLRALLTLFPHALLDKTPIIWNIGLGRPSEGVVKYLNDIGLRVTDHVFIESDEQLRRVFTPIQRRSFKKKFVIFHKGIDTTEFDPDVVDEGYLETEGVLVGTAASITPRKGLDVFVEAAAKVKEEFDRDVHFFVAGDVPNPSDERYKQELHDLIERRGLDGQFTFLGWVEDMPAYLRDLDVFVLASNNEGIPGAVREAMAMETPVVATDVGGTSDVIVDGETGYLVPPRDSEAISESVSRLLTDDSNYEAIASRAREHIQRGFSVESYVENSVQLFQTVNERAVYNRNDW